MAAALAIIFVSPGCGRENSTADPANGGLYMGKPLTIVPADTDIPDASRTLAASLRKLDIANPIQDLDRNLAQGNEQFVGINGYACAPPGLDQSGTVPPTPDQELIRSKGVRCIEGTTDVLPSDHPSMDLFATAWHYAESYNQALLRRIRRN